MIPALDERAAEWWNSLVGWSKVYVGMPNECPPCESIVFAFSLISPPFVFATQCCKDKTSTWEMIRDIIASILPNETIPPIDPFNPFLNNLFEIKDKLAIDTEQKMILMLEKYVNLRNPSFLLWSFPESIPDQSIYFSAISTMIKNQVPFMKKYLYGQGYADQFFDRFLPLIDSQHINISSSVIDMLCSLLTEKIYSFSNLSDVVSHFLEQLWKAIVSPNMSLSVCAWRAVILMLNLGKDCFSATEFLQTIDSLIKVTINIPSLRYLTCQYLVKVDIPRFSYLTLVRQLLYIETTSVDSFDIVTMLINAGVFLKYQQLMQILFTIALQDSIWSRAAISCLSTILNQKLSASDTQWFLSAVRSILTYVGVIAGSKGNAEQCDAIIDCLGMITDTKVDWVVRAISKPYTALIVTKTLKKHHSDIPLDKAVDYSIMRDIEIAASRPNVRIVLNNIMDTTVIPEQIERSKSSLLSNGKTSRTPRPQIAKPPTKNHAKKSTANAFKSTVKTALPRSRSFPLKQKI
ncbi:hypothetical protein TVAG_025790 [Trichomonas vaginalis G3]|uniref:Uncharacterized protein n=1 Tax=Trichomonas vaginalis (strain ATCC PRA-98 / G3) TaxID=412133 RepID=A2F0K1_TRIV3|nr:hypothetical protein TVAGG3_0328720 [Trichomonas vaginalis G3]EAY01581.1 hypothetical protein TVAG_025790 [Trichomonas vaginalis G3]KAI5529804.1 hypothetical protein TVAGG3_0328720 [Trichomonas vaginalis G3]|eukprot:XP_001314222.1 hypothetical protein [Trichomonas vaginalis G3]